MPDTPKKMRSREEIEKEVEKDRTQQCIDDFQCSLLYHILEVCLDIRDTLTAIRSPDALRPQIHSLRHL